VILTDREIKLAIRFQRIIIDPQPDDSLFSATSVDLTLHDSVRRWRAQPTGVNIKLAPGTAGYNYKDVQEQLTEPVEPIEGGFTINPGDFLLAWTKEQVRLPVEHGIAARVEGKSSLGRIGIGVHVTAPTIHAGFAGSIQLEICNHAPNPVVLTPGMKICQLIFELTMGTPEKAYRGQFLEQQAK
jgi:dCTP deaminase